MMLQTEGTPTIHGGESPLNITELLEQIFLNLPSRTPHMPGGELGGESDHQGAPVSGDEDVAWTSNSRDPPSSQ